MSEPEPASTPMPGAGQAPASTPMPGAGQAPAAGSMPGVRQAPGEGSMAGEWKTPEEDPMLELDPKLEQYAAASAGNIAKRWKVLSGSTNWKNMLQPLDRDLREYLIHYGEREQATYDTFISTSVSRFAGASMNSKKNMFGNVGLGGRANPYKYEITKYLYATSKIEVPQSFIMKNKLTDAWSKQSNWMGYVAVNTDEGKGVLGRRDILVAWRGTLTPLEWVKDFEFPLVPATELFPNDRAIRMHHGFLSVYISDNQASPHNRTSARDQALAEVRRLIDKYSKDEVSITVIGHSLGAALGNINAADIVAKGVNKQGGKNCQVTAFLYATPKSGNTAYKQYIEKLPNLHILRVTNVIDPVPHSPAAPGFVDVGEVLTIDTRKSGYIKDIGAFAFAHSLEAYLHGIAGTQGSQGGFKMEVNRPLALVNKNMDLLKERFRVPGNWWGAKNKGMLQGEGGHWNLNDREKDDSEPGE